MTSTPKTKAVTQAYARGGSASWTISKRGNVPSRWASGSAQKTSSGKSRRSMML